MLRKNEEVEGEHWRGALGGLEKENKRLTAEVAEKRAALLRSEEELERANSGARALERKLTDLRGELEEAETENKRVRAEAAKHNAKAEKLAQTEEALRDELRQRRRERVQET